MCRLREASDERDRCLDRDLWQRGNSTVARERPETKVGRVLARAERRGCKASQHWTARRQKGLRRVRAYIVAPICHGTNSASPYPKSSDLVCAPDAVASTLRKISS